MSNKPITVSRAEFMQRLTELVNEYSHVLPFFAIEDVLREITRIIHGASENQLRYDADRYEQACKAEQAEHYESEVE